MKNIPLYIDTVFCVVVLPMMIIIFPVERWFHNFQWYVVSVGLWLYCLYALNRLVTVPWLFGNARKRAVGIALIAISAAVTYGFSQVTLYPLKPSVYDIGIERYLPSVQQYRQAVWSLFMIVEAFSFAIGLLTQTNVQRAHRRAVEAERDKAEIALYKAQIKPHFMFNTLNTLYGLFLTKDEHALESLEKFIAMMRYIHISSTCDLVPLSDEVDYIKQYVALQSLRLNGMTTVTLDTDIADDGLRVPPMLLVTFVENCFKHGVSPVERGHISLTLRECGGKVEFSTSNRIFPVKRIGEHLGIENCRRRLELFYPGCHELAIDSGDGIFSVRLSIDLSKYDKMCGN